MPRVNKYLTGAKKSGEYPTDFIFFDVETSCEKDDFGRWATLPLKLGVAIYVSNGEVKEVFRFTEVEFFWGFVLDKVKAGRVLYMFAHNAMFDLRVLQFHDQLYDNWGWGIRRSKNAFCIFPEESPVPFVLDWEALDDMDKPLKKRKIIRMMDSGNFFGTTKLSSLAGSIGMQKMDDVVNYKKEPDRWFNAVEGSEDWETLFKYCEQDVRIVMNSVNAFYDFLRSDDLGPAAISAAGQAMKTFKYKFMDERSIAVHNHPAAMALERDAYFGARTELLVKRGRIDAEIRELDINSMYPYIMVNYPMPVAKKQYVQGVQASRSLHNNRLKNALDRGYCVIARVKLFTPVDMEPVVPTRMRGRLEYGCGYIDTVLTTPELKKALNLQIVTDVLEYSVYESSDTVFASFVTYFYEKRQAYKAQGNDAFAFMCKLMMNSLYGKFGQFNYKWTVIDPDSDIEGHMTTVECIGLEPGQILSVRGDNPRVYRNLAGRIEFRDSKHYEPDEGVCSIAAHITAYGRVYLAELIELAGGRKNVLYCDTDSLHLINDGAERLYMAGVIDSGRLGALKVEEHIKVYDDRGWPAASTYAIYNAPKDYELQGKPVKHKGVPIDAEEVSPHVFKMTGFEGAAGALRSGNLNQARTQEIIKEVSGKYTKAHVAEDGTITPWVFYEGIAYSREDYLSMGLQSVLKVTPVDTV